MARRRAVTFAANRGQAPEGVLFQARGQAFEASFERDAFVLRVLTGSGNDVHAIEQRIAFVGADPRAAIEPLDRQPGILNYFLGNDPSHWVRDLPTYARLRYREIYPGIDLLFYDNHGKLEYDFVAKAGADPSLIRLRMGGTTTVRITAAGELQAGEGTDAVLHRPLLYQNRPNGKRAIGGRFVKQGDGTLGFEFGSYDTSLPLVIDPTLSLIYSTYLGGIHDDVSSGITLDANNNIYIVGDAASQDFPVSSNAYQTERLEIGVYKYSVVVMKFSPAGALMYSTFLEGSNGNDKSGASQVLVDSKGNAYFTGTTQSTNFPTTANAYQSTLPSGASQSAFLAEISPDGSQLVYSTLFTGPGGSSGMQLAFNAQGKIYLAGSASTGLPTTAGAYMKTLATGNAAFLAEFDLTQTGPAQLVASTYYGTNTPQSNSNGNGNYAFSLALDQSSNVWVTGESYTNGLPTSANALQPTVPALNANCDGGGTALNSAVFLAKLSSNLSTLMYGSYLSGQTSGSQVDDCSEFSRSLAVDSTGDLYITGSTASSTFPVTTGVNQPAYPGEGGISGYVGFLTKLSSDGSKILWSTYLGGNGGNTFPINLQLDSQGDVWVGGQTSGGTNFPITQGAYQTTENGTANGHLTEYSSDGTKVLYGTYLGGSGSDSIQCLTFDALGNIYVTGDATSTNFPVTATAFQPKFANGDIGPDGNDIFVTILGVGTLGAISPASAGNAGDTTVTISGAGLQPGATCSLAMGSSIIAATSATVAADGNSIVCTFALNGAAPGSYNVEVTSPNASPLVENGAFTVTAGTGPDVWLTVVGRPAVRYNVPSTFVVSYGNSGDADAIGVTVFIIASAGVTAQYTGSLASLPAVPNLTYSQFPVSYQINGQTVIPLMLARVPTSGSGELPIQITVPSSVTDFSIQAYDWPPFASSLAELQQGFGTANTPALVKKLEDRMAEGLLPLSTAGPSINSAAAAACINDLVQLASNLIQSLPWAKDAACAVSLAGFIGNAISTAAGSQGADASSAGISLSGLYAGAGQAALNCIEAFASSTPIGIAVNTVLSAIQAALAAQQTLNDCMQIAQPRNNQNKMSKGAGSIDPNFKAGPVGDGSASQWVEGKKGLTYQVGFENEPTATLPAAQVVITDQLDPTKVNLATVSLSSVAFGTNVINLPSGTSNFNTTYSLNSSLSVRIQGSLNANTGLLTWTLTSIDPSTGLPPSDPTVGFLPPDTDGVSGQGSVILSVMPVSGIATGTAITNQATVVFDTNAPIDTPAWTNTIDSTPPVAAVQALPATEAQIVFPVSWSGTDVGSGINTYYVFVSDNGGAFVLWQAGVTLTSANYTGQPGHTYGFYAIATDKAGNPQPVKSVADTSTTVSSTASGFTLSPASANVSASGGSGTITVTAPSSTASWTAVDNTPAWITLTGAVSGTGSGTVGYQVDANQGIARTGTLTVANLTFTITQAGPVTTNGQAFYPVTPCRVADTRNANGPFGGPIMAAGSTRTFAIPSSACNIPSTAVAYSLNVTVVPPAPLTYLTAWPTGAAQPYVSTLNSYNGAVVANAAILPAGTGGQISIFVSDATNVVIDINGYFGPPAGAGALAFYPVTPCRVADTRNANGAFGGPSLGAGGTRSFDVPQSTCGIPATAQAYSLNMTVVPPGPLEYLTTWPTGQTQPYVSTLNALQGQVAANAAIVPAGTNGAISVYVSDASNVIVDINGYFAPPAAGALFFYPVTPCRIADTRNATGTFGGPSLGAGSTRTFPVPSSACSLPSTAQAYSLNFTVAPPGSLFYLSTWPAGQPLPVVSTLNDLQGQVVANAAIVPAGTGSSAGAISVYVSDATNLIIDVNGYFGQ